MVARCGRKKLPNGKPIYRNTGVHTEPSAFVAQSAEPVSELVALETTTDQGDGSSLTRSAHLWLPASGAEKRLR